VYVLMLMLLVFSLAYVCLMLTVCPSENQPLPVAV